MVTMLIIIHVLVCIFLTLVVLLQQGNKQGMGAAFGGGGSATVFGGRGANTFLQKLTAGAAMMFMVTSLTLSYLSSPKGVMEDEGSADAPKKVEAPAEPGSETKTGDTKPAEGAAAATGAAAAPPGAAAGATGAAAAATGAAEKPADAPKPVEPAPK